MASLTKYQLTEAAFLADAESRGDSAVLKHTTSAGELFYNSPFLALALEGQLVELALLGQRLMAKTAYDVVLLKLNEACQLVYNSSGAALSLMLKSFATGGTVTGDLTGGTATGGDPTGGYVTGGATGGLGQKFYLCSVSADAMGS